MADQAQSLAEFVDKIPTPDEIKDRLAENLHEAKLLRQLLKIAEQKQQSLVRVHLDDDRKKGNDQAGRKHAHG